MNEETPWITVWGRSPWGAIWHAAEAKDRDSHFAVKVQSFCGRYPNWHNMREPHEMTSQQRRCPTCMAVADDRAPAGRGRG